MKRVESKKGMYEEIQSLFPFHIWQICTSLQIIVSAHIACFYLQVAVLGVDVGRNTRDNK